MAEAARSGALASAGIRKLYMPTALLKEHLPSGMGSLERVPRLSDSEESSYSARLHGRHMETHSVPPAPG